MRRFMAMLVVLGCARHTHADVITTFNESQWHTFVGDYSSIDFTGLADGTPISTQYAEMGVTFTGPTFIFASAGFIDGWAIDGPSGVHIHFNQPQSWIAIHHAGNAYFKLYSQGQLIGTSDFDPIGGFGSFLGTSSGVAFDEVIITKPPLFGTHIAVDNLYWGVPAPGALGLLGIAGLSSRRRRT